MTAPTPHPLPDADTGPFWAGCRQHRLLLQRCDECSAWRFPPRSHCRTCSSTSASWADAGGRGVVASYTVCHAPVLPAYADRVPYVVIVVELDEGPYLVSTLVGAEPSIGLPVAVTFDDVNDTLTLPQFAARDGT